MKSKIILASGSPRRIEMMQNHGYDPVIYPANIIENDPIKSGMCETVMFLALKKAQAVLEDYRNGKIDVGKNPEEAAHPLIVSADTIVYKDGEIMGKPKDYADGFRMLSNLRNDVHYVVTGVCILRTDRQETRVFSDVTKVYFKDYSDEELDCYLKTDEAYDKAGGYAIQETFSKYTDHIEGSYNNVVGFPWERIEKELNIILPEV